MNVMALSSMPDSSEDGHKREDRVHTQYPLPVGENLLNKSLGGTSLVLAGTAKLT